MLTTAQFGIIPDTGKDLTEGFSRLIDYCKKNSVDKVTLAAGEYDFFAESAAATDTALFDCRNSQGKVATVLDGLAYFTLDGAGATFVLHGAMSGLLVKNCRNCVIKSINFRYAEAPFTELIAVENDKKHSIFRVTTACAEGKKGTTLCEGGEPYSLLIGKVSSPYRRISGCKPLPVKQPIFEMAVKQKATVQGYLDVKFKKKQKFVDGEYISAASPYKTDKGMIIDGCREMIFANLNFGKVPSCAIHAQRSEHLHFSYIVLDASEGFASPYDGIDIYSCGGKIAVENSKIAKCGGSAVAVISEYYTVTEARGGILRVVPSNPNTGKVAPFAEGEVIELYDKEQSKFAATGVTQIKDGEETELTLRSATAARAKDKAMNATRIAELTFSGNVIKQVSEYGILVTASRDVDVLNNVFENVRGSAVGFAGGAHYGGFVGNVDVMGNTCNDCGGSLVFRPNGDRKAVAFCKELFIGKNDFGGQSAEICRVGKVVRKEEH